MNNNTEFTFSDAILLSGNELWSIVVMNNNAEFIFSGAISLSGNELWSIVLELGDNGTDTDYDKLYEGVVNVKYSNGAINRITISGLIPLQEQEALAQEQETQE